MTRRKVIKSSVYSLCRFRIILKRTPSCKNNSENSCTEKKIKHKSSGYPWCSICLFNDIKNRRYFYRRKYCIEKFCKDLKGLGTEIINFEEKEMIPLINKEIKSYEKQKVCHICKKEFRDDKNKKKVRDHCDYSGKCRGAAHSLCNLRHKVPK